MPKSNGTFGLFCHLTELDINHALLFPVVRIQKQKKQKQPEKDFKIIRTENQHKHAMTNIWTMHPFKTTDSFR